MADDPRAAESRVNQVREKLGDTIQEVGHRANVPARAKEAASRGAERMRSAADEVKSASGDAAAQSGLSQAVQPLAIALGSMAAGFVAGSLLPATRAEQQRMGAMSTEMKGVARNTVQEAVERGKDVAGEAMEVARTRAAEEAQEIGEHAAQDAQQAAQAQSR